MNLSERSHVHKELFSGERSSYENIIIQYLFLFNNYLQLQSKKISIC